MITMKKLTKVTDEIETALPAATFELNHRPLDDRRVRRRGGGGVRTVVVVGCWTVVVVGGRAMVGRLTVVVVVVVVVLSMKYNPLQLIFRGEGQQSLICAGVYKRK